MKKILHTIIGTTRYNIVKHDQTSLACLPGVSLVNVVVVLLHAARLGDGQTLQQHGDYFEFEKLYFTHRWVYFWHILRGISIYRTIYNLCMIQCLERLFSN